MAASSLVRSRGRSRIHEDDALGSELHDDVAAGAADDVEVGPQLNDVKVAGLRLGGDSDGEQQSNRDKPSKELHGIPHSVPGLVSRRRIVPFQALRAQ